MPQTKPSIFAPAPAPAAERAPTFEESESATRSATPTELSPLAYVTIGRNVKRKESVLLHVDGSARAAMPTRVICAAIAGGTITAGDLAAMIAGTPTADALIKLLTPKA